MELFNSGDNEHHANFSSPGIVWTEDGFRPYRSITATTTMTGKDVHKSLNPLLFHHYEPLDKSKKSIRLLQILPGDDDDTVQCLLHHHHLDSQLEYQALSYMWDHEGDQVLILCDGNFLNIGHNLWSFLHEYRRTHAYSNGWLWIDALCINQSDVQERNHQVGQMRDIYMNARSVIVWLGEADERDKDAFASLKARLYDDSWFWMFRKPYWRRMWIIQEIILAKKAYIWCGDMQGNVDDFMQISDGHPIRSTPGWRLLVLRDKRRCIETLRSSLEGSWYAPSYVVNPIRREIEDLEANFTLHSLSTSFSTSESTDVRDFVYALRGIAVDCVAKDDLLVPDYNKSPIEVLVDVMNSLCYLRLPALERTVTTISGKYTRDVTVEPGRLFGGKAWNPSDDFIGHLKSKLLPLESFDLVKRAQAPRPKSRSLSTTLHTHNAVVRIYLPRMKAPILFENVPVKQHTRLPGHQSPLPRDTPVRVSLPPSAPCYIFPP